MHPWGRGERGERGEEDIRTKNSTLISIGPSREQPAATFESDSKSTIRTYICTQCFGCKLLTEQWCTLLICPRMYVGMYEVAHTEYQGQLHM